MFPLWALRPCRAYGCAGGNSRCRCDISGESLKRDDCGRCGRFRCNSEMRGAIEHNDLANRHPLRIQNVDSYIARYGRDNNVGCGQRERIYSRRAGSSRQSVVTGRAGNLRDYRIRAWRTTILRGTHSYSFRIDCVFENIIVIAAFDCMKQPKAAKIKT